MKKIGFIMNPITDIIVNHDSSFAMMIEAQRRQWPIYYMQQQDIFISEHQVYARTQLISVVDSENDYYQIQTTKTIDLSELDIIIMRVDPPVDTAYTQTTQFLDILVTQGVLIINNPRSLRDYNEKLFALQFPQHCPATMVTSNANDIKAFLKKHKNIVLKPINGMGGESVFNITTKEKNLNALIDLLTASGQQKIIAQAFIPAISNGDKRILMISGKPFPHALLRVPAKDDFRGNLAAGATAKASKLTAHDQLICNSIAPELISRGIVFAGIDIIGEYLTEINITSPTCIREIDSLSQCNVSAVLFDAIASL